MDRLYKSMTIRIAFFALLTIQCISRAIGDPAAESVLVESRSLDERIDSLILQLANPSFQARETARWELQNIGLLAFEKLREASQSPNVEISKTAAYLINSFKVIWWLDSDSFAVRQLLRDYNDLSPVDRGSRMQQLVEQNSAEAFQALVRLARYEIDEQLSKSAALNLMEVYLRARKDSSYSDLATWIRQGLDGSSRTSARWLLEFAKVLDDESSDASAWKSFAEAELKLAVSKNRATTEQIASRLYGWIGQWLARTNRRQLALQLSRPRLELVTNETSLIVSAAHWALDANLPELVEELARKHEKWFSFHPHLRYLLAESFLKAQRLDVAQQTAREASDLVSRSFQKEQNLNGKPTPDNESSARREISGSLISRGMFEWAEAELLRALKLGTSVVHECRVREELADFYWDAGANDLAAKVWAPVLERADKDHDYADQLRRDAKVNERDWLDEIKGNYHFFLGLAASDRGEKEVARGELEQAYEKIRNNPDILIAMHKVAGGSEYGKRVNERIDHMVIEFRDLVIAEEYDLAREPMRSERKQIERSLAHSCNQLAWLLGCTQRSEKEAIAMSERSLALSPNAATYLDTLGRCYFAGGEITKAVEVQSQAVELEPFRRQMQRQLTEFRSAVKPQ